MTEEAGLSNEIASILKPVAEVFGLAAFDLRTDRTLLMNEHEVFPSASVIKVPLLVDLYCRRDIGELSLDETMVLTDAGKVAGSGVLKELHAGLELTLLDLAILMIVVSDNTATNMLIDRLGTESVNQRMRSLGMQRTILSRRMYDWEQVKLGKENLCTPHDMMLLLKNMADGGISGKSTSMEMLEIMARQQYKNKIPLLLPEGTRVAAKSGGIPGVSHDVAVIYASKKPYVLCVMTKDIEDEKSTNRAIGEVSKLLFEHFVS